MDAFNIAASRSQRQRSNPSTSSSSLNTQQNNKLNAYCSSPPTNATFDSSKVNIKNSNVIDDSIITSDVYNNKDSSSNEPLVRIILFYLFLLLVMNNKNKNFNFILLNELV
jgi:hypothetical protein